MRYLKYLMIGLLSFSWTTLLQANVNPEEQGASANNQQVASFREDCSNATAQINLEVNNIQARLLVGGDIWWNGSDGLYVVPKPPPGSNVNPVSSLFAGAVWLGGLDEGLNLKLAAQTYGTSSGASDFWPGPLTNIGTVGADTCENWDKFFKVSGANIDQHIRLFNEALDAGDNELDPELIPDDILGWPAEGNPFFFDVHDFELPDREEQGFAPFHDADDDGEYDPTKGDYPIIEIRGCEEEIPQYGDEMIFWIYNDAGNIHTQSGGDALQMEVQVQAFAYATNDEVNDMTFYRYKLINWAIEPIDSTYFAMWIDPDLGCYLDDYIGCDTALSLMYVYNSDALDGVSSCNDCQGVFTYCEDIPMLGVDYFRGPLGPKIFVNGVDDSDGLRNPIIGEVADTIVELGMTALTYYNNPGSDPTPTPGTTDPQSGVPQQFYNYLSGSWQDGTPFTYGGEGYNPGSTEFINYAFTESPDDPNGWSMFQENLPDGDRRTIQASGPFRLDPSAKNELIIGVVWVPNIDYPGPSTRRLITADEVAQALFDNCFDITDGPDAPDVCFVELDEEIIIALSNEESSNNFREMYAEVDLRAPTNIPEEERLYRFEGYKIYQLASPNVEDFNNPDEARLIYQVDVKNEVGTIYNWVETEIDNPIPGGDPIFEPVLEVDGQNEGVLHTFSVTEDQFASGDSRSLINHRKYYFSVIAYAHNEWEPYDNTVPPAGTGQRTPYLEGRRNVGPASGIDGYTVIPRPIVDRTLNAEYGDGPIVTRIEGIGVGGNFVDISKETREAMLSDGFDGIIQYTGGNSPIDVKVYNPLDVINGEFELIFDDGNDDNTLDDDARWILTNLETGEQIISEETIEELNEQAIAQFGFSVSIGQTDDAGAEEEGSNGAIGFDLSYEDENGPQWYNFLPPQAGLPFNYAGSNIGQTDRDRGLTNIAEGAILPYRYLGISLTTPLITPAWVNSANSTATSPQQNPSSSLNNVDIVFTPNKELWSRCVVIETANDFYYNQLGIPTEGGAENFELREAPSVSRNGGDTPDVDDTGTTGFGWFPGYAVDVESGQRLNIFFGENSTYDCDAVSDLCDNQTLSREQLTGGDMMFNPTGDVILPEIANNPGLFPYGFIAGGQHYFYVTDQEYDGCEEIAEGLQGGTFAKLSVIRTIKWAGFPILTPGTELLSYGDGLIPNEMVMKLRVDNPYQAQVVTGENNGLNKYLFRFDGAAADMAESEEEIDNQLDAINVVPNPYYGYSAYETSQFSNTVKITNLPAKCTVTIFTLDGKFVRQYVRNEERELKDLEYAPINRDQISPALEWDLNNNKAIPVASGTYLIHIDADGLGERVIKWFGIARQFDPTGL